MKKLFSLVLLALLTVANKAVAQGDVPSADIGGPVATGTSTVTDTYPWEEIYATDYSDRHVILAEIKLDGVVTVNRSVSIGAFIDGKHRGTSTVKSATGGKVYYQLEVRGDAVDAGKTITFQFYYNGREYQGSQTLAFEYQGTTGMLSDLYQFELTTISGITIPSEIHVNKGDVVDLYDYLTVTPSGASTPVGIEWSTRSEDITIDGNTMTAVNANSTGIALEGSYGASGSNSIALSTTIYVDNPATAITTTTTEITVNKGDSETLTNALNAAYTLTPADATDKVTWSIANTEIVETSAAAAGLYYPKNGGSTTMTPQILDADGSVRLSGAAVTVIVKVPVTEMHFSGGGDVVVECNVGDDIYQRLMDKLVITPDDADDKSVVWSADEDEFTIGTNSIIAKTDGWLTVTATSVSNSDVSAPASVYVRNQAKTISVTTNPLTITFAADADGTMDITGNVLSNLNIGPEGYTDLNITAVSSDRGIATISIDNPNYIDEGVEVTAFGAGTVDLTFTLTWTDYNSYNADNDSYGTQTAQATMTLYLTQVVPLEGIRIAVYDEDDNEIDPSKLMFTGEPQILNIRVLPVPDAATLDESMVVYEFTPDQSMYWGIDIYDSEYKYFSYNTSAGPFPVKVIAPGTANIRAYYDYKSGDAWRPDVELRMDIPFTLKNGWNWFSSPSGQDTEFSFADLQNAAENTAENDWAKAIVEVRSQNALLFNDPVYGFFGDISRINYQTGYKIKTDFSEVGNEAPAALRLPGMYLFGASGINFWDIYEGWNWVFNPYVYVRSLNQMVVIDSSFDKADYINDRIVGKDGFATFDGESWVGTLEDFKPCESYMYYKANSSGMQIRLESEFDLDPEDTPTFDPSRAAKSNGVVWTPWQYDDSQFSDNMSMVATVEGMTSLSDWSLGAYVGDECRGEGKVIDGRFFATVHGKAGEAVSFKLYNKLTGELYAINGSLPLRMLVGSLNDPQKLVKGQLLDVYDVSQVIDGIGEISTKSSILDGDTYTLGGVKVSKADAARKGVYIVKGKTRTIKMLK